MEVILDELNRLPAVISFLLLFSIVIFLSFVLRWLWINLLLKLAKKTTTNLDIYFFKSTKTPAQLIFIAVGLNFLWNLYGGSIIMHLQVIPGLEIGFINEKILDFCYLFLTFTIILFFWRAFFTIIDWYQKDIAVKTETKLDEKIIPTIRKILKVVLFGISFMVISEHFQWPLSRLWAAAGIGSLAIALAAKDTFANIISGVIILIDRPFLIGDRIELADGTFGDVVDIGLRSTKILSFDNTIYILPNADISNQRITNHAYPDFKIKIRHTIGVAYGTDIEKVKRVINDILAKHESVMNVPEWGIYFTDFGDSSLNLLVIYWVSDYKNKFRIRDEINSEINRLFEEENIVIPFPQRDLNIISNKGE